MRSCLIICCFAVLALFCTQYSGSIKAQQDNSNLARVWEYKVVAGASMLNGTDPFDNVNVAAQVEKSLNTIASEGWELEKLQDSLFFFKRPKQR